MSSIAVRLGSVQTSTNQQDDYSSSTDRFYEENAAEYFERTVGADLTHLYEPFFELLPDRARILDAGCGSGRDLPTFVGRGYRAMGIDASPRLVALAQAYSGAPCAVLRLEDLNYDRCFDGIWACASLLHLPKVTLPVVLRRLHRALAAGGVLFASVQEGNGEKRHVDGRFYAYYTPSEFHDAMEHAGFAIEHEWVTKDALREAKGPRWLNVLARVTPRPPAMGRAPFV